MAAGVQILGSPSATAMDSITSVATTAEVCTHDRIAAMDMAMAADTRPTGRFEFTPLRLITPRLSMAEAMAVESMGDSVTAGITVVIAGKLHTGRMSSESKNPMRQNETAGPATCGLFA